MDPRTGADDSAFIDIAKALTSAYAAAGKAPRTSAYYSEQLRGFSRWLRSEGRSLDPEDIRPGDVEDWTVARREATSPRTALSGWIALKASWGWAVRRGLIVNQPFANLPRPVADEKTRRILTDDEARRIIDQTDGVGFVKRRDRSMVLMAADCGLRRSEIAAAKLADLDLATGRLLLRSTKARYDRVAALSPTTTLAIRRYLRERDRLLQSVGKPDPATLFISRHCAPLTGFGVHRIFKTAASLAGVDIDRPCHAWRSFCAVKSLEGGANELAVMALQGWRTNVQLRAYLGNRNTALALDAHATFSPVSGLDR